MKDRKGLCFRCEHRARFFESGSRPRYECGDTDMCVSGCYMYKPVCPVVLAKADGDERSQFDAPMISARSRFVEVADMELAAKICDSGSVLYWVFDTES
jgi:hypothetical protein